MQAIGAAAALGALAGGRTFAVPALLSRRLEQLGDRGVAGPVTDALAAPRMASALTVLAAAELVADKLPMMGARTEPLAILGRVLAGALAGAAAAEMLGRRPVLPALVGAATAYAGAHLAYRLRRGIRRKADVPDQVVAIAEDAIVLGLGGEITRNLLDGMADLLAEERYG
jgi:uncharacterized membrane protein